MITFLRLTGPVLGMLLLVSSYNLGTGSAETTSISPIVKPYPGESAGIATPIDNPQPIPVTAPAVPAFPGAEGFGAYSVGGRGGRVIEVTNLNDSGPGSLRAAVQAEGPRIVVFRTGGTIELQSELRITNPFITIAGQTAPGGGIALKSSSAYEKNTLKIQTHDVIIRYIRLRTGPSDQIISSRDGIVIYSGSPYNVIIDHCSISWAVDENISTGGDVRNITIQWSIISEALRDSSHEKGPHSMGMLLGSEGSRDISVHHNLFAHNNARNPRIKTSGLVDVVNNLIYNAGYSAISDDYAKVPVNYVGNYFINGADDVSNEYFVDLYLTATDYKFEVYLQGNITPNRPTDLLPEYLVMKPEEREWIVPARHDAPLVTTTSAFEAYPQVLANAGATIGLDSQGSSYWRRDAVDERIVDDVRNGTGRIIDDPSEVGGWPELAAGKAPTDNDHDGMPNEWETTWGFHPCDSSDGPGDADGDGYTNVEEYLNGTDPGSGTATGICHYLYLPFGSFYYGQTEKLMSQR